MDKIILSAGLLQPSGLDLPWQPGLSSNLVQILQRWTKHLQIAARREKHLSHFQKNSPTLGLQKNTSQVLLGKKNGGGKWQFCFPASYLHISDGMLDFISHNVAASLSHLHCKRTTKKGKEEQSNVMVVDICPQNFDNFSALAVLSHHMAEVHTLKTVCRKS